MVCAKPLKHCLDLPRGTNGCYHWLRSETTKGRLRGVYPRWGTERMGLLVLQDQWIEEEEMAKIQLIPRKTARCYACRTNFIIMQEKYAGCFKWYNVVAGHHTEAFYNTYHPDVIEEFMADAPQALAAPAPSVPILP